MADLCKRKLENEKTYLLGVCVCLCVCVCVCVTTQSLKLCVTRPVVHLCSVGASHTSHISNDFTQTVTANNGRETTLPTRLPRRPRIHIRN